MRPSPQGEIETVPEKAHETEEKAEFRNLKREGIRNDASR
jgi:hypothetical protein